MDAVPRIHPHYTIYQSKVLFDWFLLPEWIHTHSGALRTDRYIPNLEGSTNNQLALLRSVGD